MIVDQEYTRNIQVEAILLTITRSSCKPTYHAHNGWQARHVPTWAIAPGVYEAEHRHPGQHGQTVKNIKIAQGTLVSTVN